MHSFASVGHHYVMPALTRYHTQFPDVSIELSLSQRMPDLFDGTSDMGRISRDPADLVASTIGSHQHYPDGFVLYLGTMFAPIQDRDGKGQGFTHKVGDVVTIASPKLGRLSNRVVHCGDAEPWTFGTGALMKNLAGRRLI